MIATRLDALQDLIDMSMLQYGTVVILMALVYI